jgi:ABC-type polysaccharide/polyol phosphate export permease
MNWVEIYRFRYFLRNMVVRDLKVRYKGSALGFLWSLMNPLLMMLVFYVVFTFAFKINIPHYPVFLLCGLVPWNFFAISISNATGSIIGQAGLVKKVAFPREILPLASNLANLVHFGIGLLILFGLMVIFRVKIGYWALGLPVLVLTQVVFVFGLSLILSSLNVFYRDVQQILEVLIQLWFYLTPTFYSLSMIPERIQHFQRLYQSNPTRLFYFLSTIPVRRLYLLNPMAGLVTMYRAILFENQMPSYKLLLTTVIVSLFTFLLGTLVFRRYRSRFAEEL